MTVWQFRFLGLVILLGGAVSGCHSDKLEEDAADNEGHASHINTPIPMPKEGKEGLAKPSGFPFSEQVRSRLIEVIESWNVPYDHEVNLLLNPAPKPQFKNNWVSKPMHPIRWSIEYAVTCMDTGEQEYRERAFDILRTALPYQDIDPESQTYGLWPDFMEIPIPKMRKVDGNSADFIGIALMQIRFLYEEYIPADLLAQIDRAILHAAHSVKRRDVTVTYTNPAMMSLVVTLIAGQAYQDEKLWDYGVDKLKKILKHTKKHGFSEYNSPNYNLVVIDALQKVKNYIKDPSIIKIVDELYYLAWKHIALRYHVTTGQWSGPHSRCYQEILLPSQTRLIEAAASGDLTVAPMNDLRRGRFLHRHFHVVPEKLRHYFLELDDTRIETEVFEKPAHDWVPPVVGTTWMSPKLSVGSVNRGDMWNQRRNLQAYWGNRDAPSYLRTRFMKNDYDFACANIYCNQEQGTILGAVNFSNNAGDRHLFLDAIKNGTFEAKSLRLRFELGGSAAKAKIKLPDSLDDYVSIVADGMQIAIKAPVALMDGVQGRWESGRDEETSWLDLVIYEGRNKRFSLLNVSDSVIGFGMIFSETPISLGGIPKLNYTIEDNRLSLHWGDLFLSIPTLPYPKKQIQTMVEYAIEP